MRAIGDRGALCAWAAATATVVDLGTLKSFGKELFRSLYHHHATGQHRTWLVLVDCVMDGLHEARLDVPMKETMFSMLIGWRFNSCHENDHSDVVRRAFFPSVIDIEKSPNDDRTRYAFGTCH